MSDEKNGVSVTHLNKEIKMLESVILSGNHTNAKSIIRHFAVMAEDILQRLNEYVIQLNEKKVRIQQTKNTVLKSRMENDLKNEVHSYLQQVELLIYDYQKMVRDTGDISLEAVEYVQLVRSNVLHTLSERLSPFLQEI